MRIRLARKIMNDPLRYRPGELAKAISRVNRLNETTRARGYWTKWIVTASIPMANPRPSFVLTTKE